MGAIYSQAKSVISWLGKSGDDSDKAIELIRNFGEQARKYLHKEIPASLLPFWETMHWHDFLNDVLRFPMEEQNWVALWKLFGRPYWSRVWIVQELVGAGIALQSRGIILCGTASVEKSLLDYACSMIVMGTAISNDYRPKGDIIDEPRRTFELMGHPQAFVMWETTAECAFGPVRGHGLDQLVKATKRLRATDSRDMIYALIGMAPQKYHSFPIDYRSPLKEILISYVKFMVRIDENLNSLLGNRFQMQRSEPTWTPEVFQGEHGWVPGVCQLWPAGSTKPKIHFDDTNETLFAKGILIGRVNRVIGPEVLPEDGKDPRPPKERDSSSYTKELGEFRSSLISPAVQETFWRTLVLDHDSSTLKPQYPAPAEFGTMASVLFFGEKIPEDFMEGESFELRLSTFVFPFKKSWERMRWNRCFFTTEEGHMGVGPFCLQHGDIVVLLYGGEYLFVLRETEESETERRYNLVGDAYVHGFMHGELVNHGESGNSQIFAIN
ncbi:hypothetical protein N431DRAFT_398444 [Stipitochalara longipes BDJ]|nr:hypothetical protein N431DRAFT_398444 [Stipitochalara longipes BDJ]